MMPNLTRRRTIQLGAAAALVTGHDMLGASAAEFVETHGLSTFGDLAEPPDFQHFAYVNPAAPKGGTLAIQITQTTGNQAFQSFDTLNIYVLKGNGAAGMDATFDTLMAGTADEPTSQYGLVARAVQISQDKLTYRFLLRKEARFHDGSRLTAKDVAFSLNILKTKGHPTLRIALDKMVSATPEGDDVLIVQLDKERSRSLHLVVAGMPIFSAAYWQGKDFEAATQDAPLGSGPYKVARFEPGRTIEFALVPDYWAKDLPVNIGQNNFSAVRYEYFREAQVAFEAFKSGTLNFREEFTSRLWFTGYNFPAMKSGVIKREVLHSGRPIPSQGWYFNTRRKAFADARVREAIGLLFDFEWTNKNIMFSSYKRLVSYFQNSPMMALDKPDGSELALLEPFRSKLDPAVFEAVWIPPVSDGSGSDRALLTRANDLLMQAGCKRSGAQLLTPDGAAFNIEFLDANPALQPHTEPFQSNLRRLGINATSRIVDDVQYQQRVNTFDFDIVTVAMGGTTTPGDDLRVVFGSQAASTQGSRNLIGLADPVIDALIQQLGLVKTRAELDVAARAFDRVFRAGHYWVPMWYRDTSLVAFRDEFSRPAQQPKFDTGAPSTWWFDAAKASVIKMP